jgi:predicted aminopeptidase
MRSGRAAKALAALAFLGGGALWSACSAAYVTRAAYEEAKILWRRQPIERMLEEPGLSATDERKLRTVLEARTFAEERLGLRVGGSYRSVSRIDSGAVVQLLVAARRDRLEPYTWWFPIVGRVPYKGFFSKKAATSSAAALEREGYDTYVRPAIAFSTLGWFDDPLPSVLLQRDEVTLAEVIFHELFHNTLFVPGQVTFDESAATFAGHRAAIDFFCERRGPETAECRQAGVDWQEMLTISRFLRASLAELEKFYATRPAGDLLEQGRQRAFSEIRRQFGHLNLRPGRMADFATGPINNASLLEQRVYLQDLDVFAELDRQRGGLRGALEALRGAVDRGGDPFDRLYEAVSRPRGAEVARLAVAPGR